MLHQNEWTDEKNMEKTSAVQPVDKAEEFFKHILREHTNMADTWANRRAGGRTESWVTQRKWKRKNIKSVMGCIRTGVLKTRAVVAAL